MYYMWLKLKNYKSISAKLNHGLCSLSVNMVKCDKVTGTPCVNC